MPKLDPKQIQKELESNRIWPVYWLYGTESMKSRELLKRIRSTVLGEGAQTGIALNEVRLDGAEVEVTEVIDSAQSLSFGGSLQFVVVRDAHLIKDSDELSELLGPAQSKEDLKWVCVFLSKDLDGRKKFSKVLTEKAAVVPCEEVTEVDQETWIQYLAKRKGVQLSPSAILSLRALEPWTLDIVDREIEKLELAEDESVLIGGMGGSDGANEFVEAVMVRDRAKALSIIEKFAEHPEDALPLLGLLAWNLRYLALYLADPRGLKINPYLADRLRKCSSKWKKSEVVSLNSKLAQLDFGMKQTQCLGLGLWFDTIAEI